MRSAESGVQGTTAASGRFMQQTQFLLDRCLHHGHNADFYRLRQVFPCFYDMAEVLREITHIYDILGMQKSVILAFRNG